MHETFKQAQIKGMSPSLLKNRIGIPAAAIHRICEKIRVTESGCWEWMGAKRRGYGAIRIRSMQQGLFGAHRLCYQMVNGKIPDDLDVHHKTEDGCMGPSCVNPDHIIIAVTRREHLVNLTPESLAFIARHKTACVNGHTYTIETMRVAPAGNRRCLVCERQNQQKYRDERRALEGREKYRWPTIKKKTHCKRGHALVPENLYFQGRYGHCLTCKRENQKMYDLKAKAYRAVRKLFAGDLYCINPGSQAFLYNVSIPGPGEIND